MKRLCLLFVLRRLKRSVSQVSCQSSTRVMCMCDVTSVRTMEDCLCTNQVGDVGGEGSQDGADGETEAAHQDCATSAQPPNHSVHDEETCSRTQMMRTQDEHCRLESRLSPCISQISVKSTHLLAMDQNCCHSHLPTMLLTPALTPKKRAVSDTGVWNSRKKRTKKMKVALL